MIILLIVLFLFISIKETFYLPQPKNLRSSSCGSCRKNIISRQRNNLDSCLSCSNCGICEKYNGDTVCMRGNIDGPKQIGVDSSHCRCWYYKNNDCKTYNKKPTWRWGQSWIGRHIFRDQLWSSSDYIF
jgi:hypothetical protein